jgi:hypothetical protein
VQRGAQPLQHEAGLGGVGGSGDKRERHGPIRVALGPDGPLRPTAPLGQI